METPKDNKIFRLCPRCPHRLSDLASHDPTPDPLQSLPEIEETSKMTATGSQKGKKQGVGSPIKILGPGVSILHPSARQNHPSTLLEHVTVLEASQPAVAAAKLSMEEFDMVSDERGKRDAWAESATGKAHMGICPVCGGYFPIQSGENSLATPISAVGRSESSGTEASSRRQRSDSGGRGEANRRSEFQNLPWLRSCFCRQIPKLKAGSDEAGYPRATANDVLKSKTETNCI